VDVDLEERVRMAVNDPADRIVQLARDAARKLLPYLGLHGCEGRVVPRERCPGTEKEGPQLLIVRILP